MGSMSSLIADEEKEERYGQMLARQKREEECQKSWERFLRGEGTDLGNILEYARKLDEEVKLLRQKVEATERFRLVLKGFINGR